MPKVFILIIVITSSGCVTYNAATGRNEMILVSTDSEVAMGRQANAQILTKSRLSPDKAKEERLNRIGQRLARVCDRQDYQYHFNLIENNELNAFTVPGGYIYFYTGLFDRLSDDQVASVLAHEIGHCAARHTVKKFQAALGYNVARNVVMRVISYKVPGASSIVGLGADGIMSLATSAYGRQDEYQADKLGIKYMYLAGYDLNGMIQAFEVLQTADKSNKAPLILRTHPFIKDRIVAIKKEIAAVKEKY